MVTQLIYIYIYIYIYIIIYNYLTDDVRERVGIERAKKRKSDRELNIYLVEGERERGRELRERYSLLQ